MSSLLGKTIVAGFATAVAALILGTPPAPAQAATGAGRTPEAPKRVLVLHDENKDELPGLARTDRSLREAFKAGLGAAVEIHSESIGLSRARRPGYDSQAADFYRSKYAALPPDLIVAVMEPPLDFVLRHADTMFPGVPIAFAGIDASTLEGRTLPGNVTGVLVKRTYSPTLEVALSLQPGTRNVFVVGGTAPFDRFLQTFVRRDLQPYEDRVAVSYLFDTSMEEAIARLSRLPERSVILYVSMLRDGSGRRFVPADALSSIAAAANAPVYVFLDQYVGLGAVGGNVYSFVTHGEQVAALGLQILRGASPASLPVRELSAQVNLFDARQLKRWNLDAAGLPPGSVVRYQDVSVWVLYRWYIVGVIAALSLQGVLIVGLVLARARERRAQAEIRRQRNELTHALRVTTLGELAASFAHELGQPLAAILLNAQAAQRLRRVNPADREIDDALSDIADAATYSGETMKRLHALFRKEHAERVQIDVNALIEEILRLLRTDLLQKGIEADLARGEGLPQLYADPIQLRQVILNLIVNAEDALASAADGPRRIHIETGLGDASHIAISVRDSGVGLDESGVERMFDRFVTSKPNGLGMGLAISRSIVEAHGGRIWASRNPDRGLTLHVELPASQA